jgi:hypothetical protein
MRIHSSSLSTNTANHPTSKNSVVQDVSLVSKTNSQNPPPNKPPTPPNEIKRILSSVALQANEGATEGLDTRTSKALLAYRMEAHSSIKTADLSAITGIDVYA